MKTNDINLGYSIVVHSHLDWSGVWQRPQQFFSRLSERHPILFIEAPLPSEQMKSQVISHRLPDFPNVRVLRMHFAPSEWNDPVRLDGKKCRLLKHVLSNISDVPFFPMVQWFYDPMAVNAFARQMGENLIVYDCMDQLAQFKNAPKDLEENERRLLALADVVFAGGPKLFKAKSRYNQNCHCFGCGVDAKHFGKAQQQETRIPEDLSFLPRPIFGYFGVIDERIDYELIRKLAEANPTGSVVMIGPHSKVDPSTFPRRPNLHWMGRREYQQLPSYCKGFDACLMPFAINEATEYLNPTKAQEYMATGKPIVSTALEDVVLQFKEIIQIAHSHSEFVQMCRDAADRPNPDVICRGLEQARQASWEAVVQQIERHIDQLLLQKLPEARTALPISR